MIWIVIILILLVLGINFCILNKKDDFIFSILKKIIFVVYIGMFIFMGVIVPYIFINAVFTNKIYVGILMIISIITCVIFVISILTKITNRVILNTNKIKEIYIRDIPVDYSPAVVSYLMNGKIEEHKDLVATLLDLSSKEILKMEIDNGKITKVIDLKNEAKIKNLPSDEKVAYDMFVNKITKKKIDIWKQAVYSEYKSRKFSNENKQNLTSSLLLLYILFIIIFVIIILIFGKNGTLSVSKNTGELINMFMVTIFFAAWETSLFKGFKKFFDINDDNEQSQFREIYTKKGAKEDDKWERFERFVKVFTNIKQAELNSVVIFEKYLAYAIALNINKEYKQADLKFIEDRISLDLNENMIYKLYSSMEKTEE